MTQYATTSAGATSPANPAVLYWKVSGIAFGAVALLGIVMNLVVADGVLARNVLAFDWTHNVLHLALAAIALTLGFTSLVEAKLVKMVALVVGAVYLLLGVIGFMSGDIWGVGRAIGLRLELGENLIHLALGAYGVFAGLQN